MALSEKHRSDLYTYFEPRLGGDVTEAMLREFPKGSGDELVTREYLDLRLDAVSAKFEAGLSDLRAELIGVRGTLSGRLTTLFISFTTILLAALAIATTIIVNAGN